MESHLCGMLWWMPITLLGVNVLFVDVLHAWSGNSTRKHVRVSWQNVYTRSTHACNNPFAYLGLNSFEGCLQHNFA
jgi:hypothetical protein